MISSVLTIAGLAGTFTIILSWRSWRTVLLMAWQIFKRC